MENLASNLDSVYLQDEEYSTQFDESNGYEPMYTLMPFAFGGIPSIPSAIGFDVMNELLWVGDNTGFLSSFSFVKDYEYPSGHRLERYTSFRTSLPSKTLYTAENGMSNNILDIKVRMEGIYTLSSNECKLFNRSGVPSTLSFVKDRNYNSDLTAMELVNDKSIAIASTNRLIYFIDSERNSVIRKIPMVSVSQVVSMSSSPSNNLAFFGGNKGELSVWDVRGTQMNQVFALHPHMGSVSEIKCFNNTLITSDWIPSAEGLIPNNMFKVWDIRMMNEIATIPHNEGITRMKFSNETSQMLHTVSHNGVVSSYSLYDLVRANFSQESFAPVNVMYMDGIQSMIYDFDISPSEEIFCASDISGGLYTWTEIKSLQRHGPESHFDWENGVPIVSRFSDSHQPEPHNFVLPDPSNSNFGALDDMFEISLASFGVPLDSKVPLFSDNWIGDKDSFYVQVPREKISTNYDPNVAGVQYFPNNGKLAYNQMLPLKKNVWSSKGGNDFDTPMKTRISGHRRNSLETPGQLNYKENVPRYYRAVKIKFGRIGIAGFDFSSYNKTSFGGLENILPNSTMTNAFLQGIYFLPAFRIYMQNHLCENEFCLTCELGFLFHMLDIADGRNCHTNNFLRAFRELPEAKGLGLVEYDLETDHRLLSRLCEAFIGFIFEHLAKEIRSSTKEKKEDNFIENWVGMGNTSRTICSSCSTITERKRKLFNIPMVYSDIVTPKSFSELLSMSLFRQSVIQTWCETCKGYRRSNTLKYSTSLPDIMTITTSLDSLKKIELWRSFGKIPKRIYVKINKDKNITDSIVKVSEDVIEEDLELEKKHSKSFAVYEVHSIVYRIHDEVHNTNHLVSCVNVPKGYSNGDGGWFLFNDFSVSSCKEDEALDLECLWKLPVAVTFCRVNTADPPKYVNPITSDVFFKQSCINHPMKPFSFTEMTKESLPESGELISFDGEFVAISPEESELRMDGSLRVTKQRRLALGRLSLVRSIGDKLEPILDDYIAVREPIDDYLTQFSGLSPRDLDLSTSLHYLVTLKTDYIKFRYLIDRGCIFIGHGLQKDFRIMNVMLPKEQIIDTVSVFRLPHQRMISLKFLAFHLLGENIQSSEHDSIEDARTAHRLYNKYVELSKSNKFESTLDSIYQKGRLSNWKIETLQEEEPIPSDLLFEIGDYDSEFPSRLVF